MADGGPRAMPDGYIAPNVPPTCSWAAGKPGSPHDHRPRHIPPVSDSVLPSVLSLIGNTPMVRLDKIAASEGLQCELFAKCEFFNAGGSVKDRIGLRMVEAAEKAGQLKPGDTIIEPTSGNTGIGLALTSAVKGYRCVICLPEKMSGEKIAVLKALGAEIVRTPTEAAFDTPESYVGMCWKLRNEIPNSHILYQYRNPSNPLAHYDGTAEEILAQCGGKLDMIVVGAGTGGTVAGIGRKLKEKAPHVKVIAVDPLGSVLAEPEQLNEEKVERQLVEGIGYDFLPTVLDRLVVDQWYKCNDKDTFIYARKLIREEGLLCGGSSGSALSVAVQAARQLGKGQRCVVILPDSIRNYLTKFVDDSWMVRQGLLDPPPPKGTESWWSSPVSVLLLAPPTCYYGNLTCHEALERMKREGVSCVPVVNSEGSLLGTVSLQAMTSRVVCGKATPTSPLSAVVQRDCAKACATDSLGRVAVMLEKDSTVIISKKENTKDGRVEEVVCGVVTSADLLGYLCSQAPQ